MTRLDHLLALLRAYAPSDADEATHHRRMIELAVDAEQGGRDPFARDHFTPGHFTASAFILSPDRRSLLLVHHGKLHRWLQPGGHVDAADADILTAARREVREEVGIVNPPLAHAAIFDVDVHPIPALGDEPPHEHFDVRFLFQAGDGAFTAGSDARDARYVRLDAITAEESDASVLRAAGKLAAMV